MYHYKDCGLDNIWLKNGYKKMETAYGKSTGIHDLDGLHHALSLAIINKPAPITGCEFRFLRVEMNLSQKALSSIMDKTDQTVAKWEKNEVPVPLLADVAIRNLYLESKGSSPISGLLKELSQFDREYHELRIQLEDTEQGWTSEACA